MIDGDRWRTIGAVRRDEAEHANATLVGALGAVEDLIELRNRELRATQTAMVRYVRAGGPLDAKLWANTWHDTRRQLGLVEADDGDEG